MITKILEAEAFFFAHKRFLQEYLILHLTTEFPQTCVFPNFIRILPLIYTDGLFLLILLFGSVSGNCVNVARSRIVPVASLERLDDRFEVRDFSLDFRL